MSVSRAPAPALAYFITGTDTGIGKTRMSCALIHALRRAGHGRVVGMKPVAAGCDWVVSPQYPQGHWLNEDVAALREASSLQVPAAFDNPYALPDPLSPHLAAQHAESMIELDHIEASFHALRSHADAVVVEGAGGFMVPLRGPVSTQDPDWHTSADLAVRLNLPVIMVVGLRLGCLNHALLTQEAMAARGLKLAGWVANQVDPDMAQVDANVDTLKAMLKAPMLARWAWDPQASAQDLFMHLPVLA